MISFLHALRRIANELVQEVVRTPEIGSETAQNLTSSCASKLVDYCMENTISTRVLDVSYYFDEDRNLRLRIDIEPLHEVDVLIMGRKLEADIVFLPGEVRVETGSL